jgi:hypothetical protein
MLYKFVEPDIIVAALRVFADNVDVNVLAPEAVKVFIVSADTLTLVKANVPAV